MSNIIERLKGFLSQSKRVFQITKKPSRQEYMAIVKVTGLGIIIIGLVGLVIKVVAQMVL